MTVRDRLTPPRMRRTVARVPARGRLPGTSGNPAEACVPPTAEPFPPPPIHVPGTATNRIPPSQGKRPAMLSPSTSTPRRARRSLVPRLVSLGSLTNPVMGTFPLYLLSASGPDCAVISSRLSGIQPMSLAVRRMPLLPRQTPQPFGAQRSSPRQLS